MMCNECYARGSTCIDQEHGEPQPATTPSSEQSYSLRERVTQLEGLVREVLNRLPENNAQRESASSVSQSPAFGQGETRAAAEALKNLKTSASGPAIDSSLTLPYSRHEDAPTLSLFDNAVISRRKEVPPASTNQDSKSKRLLRELHRMLPQPKDMDIIIDTGSKWWGLFMYMFHTKKDPKCGTFRDAVSQSLPSDKPAEVAKIVLGIAVCLNQMSPRYVQKLNLPSSVKNFMELSVNTVGQLITSNDEYGATFEGIECMVLEAKFHMDLGRPRRAYILYRRAISFGQLIGLHRIGKHSPPDDPLTQSQQALWTHICLNDRYLSLILGMPYGVSDRFCNGLFSHLTPRSQPSEILAFYHVRISGLMGKIIDRNQDSENMSFSATCQLDADLQEIAREVPMAWWNLEKGREIPNEELVVRCMVPLLHHMLRTYIHLPYMLNVSDKRYDYSHDAAVGSSREILKLYSILRTDSDFGPYVCKLIDFQAFAAAMLLLLNLLGYSQNARTQFESGVDPSMSNEDRTQDTRDWAMVDETIACLKRASNEAGGLIALQSAKVLDLLTSSRSSPRDCDGEMTCEVAIPMFGVLRIGAGSKYRVPTESSTIPVSVTNTNSAVCPNSLPTPPSSNATHTSSSVHGSSAQHSPCPSFSPGLSTVMSGPPNAQSSHNKPVSNNEDHIISFDNLMGLPQIDLFQFQANQDGQGYGGLGTSQTYDLMGSDGFGPWPNATFGAGLGDLDQGWGWSGEGNMAVGWNAGMNNGYQGG